MVKNKDFLVRVNMCETSGIDLIDWIVYNDNDNNNTCRGNNNKHLVISQAKTSCCSSCSVIRSEVYGSTW